MQNSGRYFPNLTCQTKEHPWVLAAVSKLPESCGDLPVGSVEWPCPSFMEYSNNSPEFSFK